MPKATDDESKKRSGTIFPAVGVGASAGGLQAFRKLVKEIPENSEMAYILVQHPDPVHVSILAGILQKVTNITVQVITEDITVAPDNIYIGTGIGLALCQDIAIKPGGKIYAGPIENEGAAFHVLFQ